MINVINVYIFIFGLINIYFKCYIVFEFKTKYRNFTNNNTDFFTIFNELLYNNIYITLKIGSPPQNVEAFLRADNTGFYFSNHSKNDSITNEGNFYVLDVNTDIKNYYDCTKSNSYNNTGTLLEVFKGVKRFGYIVNDTFNFVSNKFFSDIKNKNTENINKPLSFILASTTTGNTPCVIGLAKPRTNNYLRDQNFIRQLKENDIIENYFFTIKYTTKDSGYFIIGEQPHIYDGDNYNYNDLRFDYVKTINILGIPYSFSEGKFGNESLSNKTLYSVSALFRYELNYILGSVHLKYLLDNYFESYINKNICFVENIKEKKFEPKIFFWCKKDLFDIKNFPNLSFYLKKHNYEFVLDYNDLWIEKNDMQILLIFFDVLNNYDFNLGKPFLKKYQLIFNHDSNTVSFYVNSNINNVNSKYKNTFHFCIICLLLLFLFIAGIYFGKVIFVEIKKRKINEIEECYDYYPNKSYEIELTHKK